MEERHYVMSLKQRLFHDPQEKSSYPCRLARANSRFGTQSYGKEPRTFGEFGVLETYSNEQEELYEIAKISDKKIRQDFSQTAKILKRGNFSDDEIICWLSSHEVRHRVQKKFKINLLYDFAFTLESIHDPDLKSAAIAIVEFFGRISERRCRFSTSDRSSKFKGGI